MSTMDTDDSSSTTTIIQQTSVNALKIILFWTSSIEELTNMITEKLVELKTLSRFVELVLQLPSTSTTKQTKHIINLSLAILANLSRTEQGALELVGFTLPEEAVYRDTETTNKQDKEDANDNVRIKPTMELLLERFLKTTPTDGPTSLENYETTEPEEWESLWYPYDAYQHFAAIAMNITQTAAGRQFIMRIPPSKAKTMAEQPLSVLQRLLPQLKRPYPTCNPIRRRGIAGMIRNLICFDEGSKSSWWLLNVAQILTPVLMPLAGPEELDLDDKRGLDVDLWIMGCDQIRSRDEQTRLYCVEAILLLCATGGRQSRDYLRKAKTYTILKMCDLVEESELISEKVDDCVQYLRRDEEGTHEGSSDKLVYPDDDNHTAKATTTAALQIEAGPSTQIHMKQGNNDNDDDDDVDYDTVD
jgi:hypothetical protein